MYWIDLTTYSGYMLASAIRGPDLRDLGFIGSVSRDLMIASDLKWIFTARIRHMCSVEYFAADTRETTAFDRPGFCERFNTLVLLHRDKLGGVWHFLSHAESALDIIHNTANGEYRREAGLLAGLARSLMLRLDQDSWPDRRDAEEKLRVKFSACVNFAENYEGE